jgi:hypothetical protein
VEPKRSSSMSGTLELHKQLREVVILVICEQKTTSGKRPTVQHAL